MTNYFDVGVAATQGSRKNQQDSYITTAADNSDAPFEQLDNVLLAVADGVGGEVSGEVASATAVKTFATAFQQQYAASNSKGAYADMLAGAAQQATEAIQQQVNSQPEYDGMATTLAAVLVTGQTLYPISVGDSLILLLRQGELTKLNKAHTIGDRLDTCAHAGEISTEEAESHPDREVLYSVLDGGEIADIDLPDDLNLRQGDRLILASDGILTLKESVLIEMAEHEKNAQDYAEKIISTIDKVGLQYQDNATVVVLDIHQGEPDTAPLTNEKKRRNQEASETEGKNIWGVVFVASVVLLMAALFWNVLPIVLNKIAVEEQRLAPAQSSQKSLQPEEIPQPDHDVEDSLVETEQPSTSEQLPTGEADDSNAPSERQPAETQDDAAQATEI